MKTNRRILMLIVLMISAYMMAGCGKTKIDLNQYVLFEATGYDGLGTAKATIDYDSLTADYGAKLKINTKKMSSEQKEILSAFYGGENQGVKLLADFYVSGSLDKTSDLKNGDSVTFRWKCEDESAAQFLNCELKHENITYPIAGLAALEEYDPFAHADIQFDQNGHMTANVDNDPEMTEIRLSLEDNAIIKNGATVIVNAEVANEKAFAERYGKTVTPVSKEFQLSGIMEHPESASSVPQDIFDRMIEQGEDALKAGLPKTDEYGFSGGAEVDSATYLGNYYFKKKSDANASWLKTPENILYLVYEVNAHLVIPDIGNSWSYWDEGHVSRDEENRIRYYFVIYYENVAVDDAGNANVILSEGSVMDNEFSAGTLHYEGTYGLLFYRIPGYTSLKDAHEACAKDKADYLEENNVK